MRGEVAGVGALGVKIVDNLESILADFDVLVDFTIADATAVNLEVCATANKAMVIGTTGLSEAQTARVRALAQKIAYRVCTQLQCRCERDV